MSQNSSKKLAELILQQYGISVHEISDAKTGYRNHSFKVVDQNNQLFNLMVFKAEPQILDRIQHADTASSEAANELPVRKRIDERIIKIKRSGGTSYAALYNYLPGRTIEWDDYTKDRLKVLGATLARLHSSFSKSTVLNSDVSIQQQASIYVELSELLVRMRQYFGRADVATAMNKKLNIKSRINFESISQALEVGKKLASQHTLHMDFVRGNILYTEEPTDATIDFGKAHISGIIDFEKTAFGSPLFDIARTLAFLYVDCKYKTAEKVKKYFLYSGYIKHGGRTIESHKLLDQYVRLFLLHDLYKFLLHNPYEHLKDNEHYIRTRDILIRFGMVEYSVED